MDQNWTQVDIETTTAGVEPVGAMLLELGLGGYAVRDSADFEAFLSGTRGRWDYIDEELMKLRDMPTAVTVYLAENEQGAERLTALRQGLRRLRALDAAGEWGALSCALSGVREEDWANAWKRYYKPVKVSERLVVCPSWEPYEPAAGEVLLRLDPGMAFGTGTHETTRLCLRMLDRFDPAGKAALDIGCGSGILAVAAMLLGADSALGVDIDENAVKVAKENAALNNVPAQFRQSDLTGGVTGKYGIVFANIVADAVISLSAQIPPYLADGGVLIASGIIDARERDVLEAFGRAGLRLVHRAGENGWVCLCAEVEG
jgi:ribosomal protein L11 methyltransferase